MYHPTIRADYATCRKCKLDANSLQPLAQLPDLRQLTFTFCTGLTTAAVKAFLTAAQLRHRLRIVILEDHSLSKEDMESTYETLKQELGAHRTLPSLFIQ
jgi:hypothetical protein